MVSGVKYTCKEVPETKSASEIKMASFQKTTKNLNGNVEYAAVMKKNQVVKEHQNTKVYQPKGQKNTKQPEE